MKVFVVFWLNTDNYRGIVIGDSDMTKQLAEEIYLEENPKEFGFFAVEEENFLDYSTKVYTY